MAIGAWSPASHVCQTLVNANPFKPQGLIAKAKHFDPFGLELYRAESPAHKPAPGLKMRIGQLKGLFVK